MILVADDVFDLVVDICDDFIEGADVALFPGHFLGNVQVQLCLTGLQYSRAPGGLMMHNYHK